MKNVDFINDWMNGVLVLPAKHGNLIVDAHDTLYSYDMHYPLAAKVKGGVLINKEPSTVTTERHKRLVRQVANDEVFEVVHVYPEHDTHHYENLDGISNDVNRLVNLTRKARSGYEYRLSDLLKKLFQMTWYMDRYKVVCTHKLDSLLEELREDASKRNKLDIFNSVIGEMI